MEESKKPCCRQFSVRSDKQAVLIDGLPSEKSGDAELGLEKRNRRHLEK